MHNESVPLAIAELHERLTETEEIIAALRSGSADALVGVDGNIIPLDGAVKSYISFFNVMNEGGLTLNIEGEILHCNPRFVNMAGKALDKLLGQPLSAYISSTDHQAFNDLLAQPSAGTCEVNLLTIQGLLPVRLSLTVMKIDCQPHMYCVVVTDLHERIQRETLLRDNIALMHSIFRAAPVGIGVFTQQCLTQVNSQMCDMAGLSLPELVGQTLRIFYASDADYERAIAELNKQVDKHGVSSIETQFEDKASGVLLDVLLSRAPLDPSDTNAGVTYTAQNISLQKQTEMELRQMAIFFECSQDGMMICDSQTHILQVNPAFTQITGYPANEVLGENPKLLSSGLQKAHFYQQMRQEIEQHDFWCGELWDRRKNGENYAQLLFINVIRDSKSQAVKYYVGVFSDISQSKKHEEEMYHLSHFDPLTNLPNRRLFYDRLQQAIKLSASRQQFGAVFFIDIDNFKTLNDTRGHDTGDLLLIEMAKRLQDNVHADDTIARLGSDEFVVILNTLDINQESATFNANAIAERMVKAINADFLLQDQRYFCSISVGITLFSSLSLSVDDILKQADRAMYNSKQAGKNAIRFFDPVAQAVLEARVQMETMLRDALVAQQFHLYYQVQVNQQCQAIGAEVLIRWIHPEKGLISPADFIPLAEEVGLILSIGQWVLESACRQLKAWENNPATQHFILAVNVSAKQFIEPDFEQQVIYALTQSGANANRLKLELTESMLVNNVDDIINKMTVLKALGISFSLDDFGTGFSSLSYLKRLPLDQLKIDQSFVRDALTDTNAAAITQAIIALGNTLGFNVIAEGVETEAQRTFLAQHQCHHYQGYLFSKPIPVQDFERLIAGF